MLNAEYPFINITPSSTLARSGSAWWGCCHISILISSIWAIDRTLSQSLNFSWPVIRLVVFFLISDEGYYTFLYGHIKYNREGGRKRTNTDLGQLQVQERESVTLCILHVFCAKLLQKPLTMLLGPLFALAQNPHKKILWLAHTHTHTHTPTQWMATLMLNWIAWNRTVLCIKWIWH